MAEDDLKQRTRDVFGALARRATGVEEAFEEATKSTLPGLSNGPGDAYRHIYGAALLTRRLGADGARAMLGLNEWRGSSTGRPGDAQIPAAEAMDHWNNDIGVRIGLGGGDRQALRDAARRAIDEGIIAGGTGHRGTPRWLDANQWSRGGEGGPIRPRWRGVAPLHRGVDAQVERVLDTPVERWSERDLAIVMQSPAYLQGEGPAHGEVRHKVTRWYDRRHGEAILGVDTTRAWPRAP